MNTLYNVCSYFWNPATTASSTPEEDTDLYTEDGWIMVNGENEIPSSLQQSKIQPNQEELLQVIERINQIIKELKSPTTDQLFKLLDEMHDENGIVLGPIISGRAIREIKMMKLNQSSKLVPLTVMIIRSFFLLKENGRLREETKKIIDTFFGEVDQCTGISFDSPLYTFTELSLQLEKLNSVDKVSEDYLITLNKMGGIELTVEDNVDHLSVSKKLTQLLFNLDRGILSQINNASLRELLYATLFLFTNYSKLLLKDSSKENVQCIVNILQKTLGILRNQIESNNKKTSKCSDEQFMFENLSNKLKSLGFHNINQAKKNYEQLCSLEPALSQIKGAIFKYNYYRYLSAGLIRISETSNICISRTANSETLVIYYSGSDNAFDLKNPSTILNHKIELSQNNYMNSYANSMCNNSLRLLKNKTDILSKASNMLFIGFGIDGAAAKFIAAKLAKSSLLKNCNIMTVGVGVPDYLSLDIEQQIDESANFKSFNFTYPCDSIIPLQENHTSKQIGVPIPIDSKDFFFDWENRNERSEKYSEVISIAFERAKVTYFQLMKLSEDIQNQNKRLSLWDIV